MTPPPRRIGNEMRYFQRNALGALRRSLSPFSISPCLPLARVKKSTGQSLGAAEPALAERRAEPCGSIMGGVERKW